MGIKARLSRRLKILVTKPKQEATVHFARDRAFLITEVLEMILLLLSMEDLLVNVQRVSRHFHKLITSSWRIQQALFFRPIQDDPLASIETNPLLERKFRPWFQDIWQRLNMIMLGPAFMARLSDYNHFQRLDWNSNYKKTKAYARKEASWRRMLVAQPPVHDLIVKMRKEPTGGPSQFKGKLKFEHGLRMGPFYDLVQDFAMNQHACYFVVRWHIRNTTENIAGPVAESELGEKKRFIAVHLCQVIQGHPGENKMIGPEFKSCGYRPIKIDYIPERRTEGVLFGYTKQDYDGTYE